MKKIYNIYAVALLGLSLFSCNDFLDTVPDNRATIDNVSKIRRTLVSAYPQSPHSLIAEISSDNIMDIGEKNPNTTRPLEIMSYWKDLREYDNDGTNAIWSACYSAIAHSNAALDAISEIGGKGLDAEKGEALITRAYSHFILVNIFAKHYNENTSATDLGITYMDKSEKTLDPKYKRASVKEVYEKINADIEAALPLISDDIFEVVAYHFNKRAAYAFAARFNLYYGRWEKAKEYATKALGVNPKAQLRNWAKLGELPRDVHVVANAYIGDPSSWLVNTNFSSAPYYLGPYRAGARFAPSKFIAETQTFYAPTPWKTARLASFDYYLQTAEYNMENLDKVIYFKLPPLFEYTDPITQTGYNRTAIVNFSADETLLVRAEAKAILGDFAGSLEDLNLWSSNFYKGNKTTTLDEINDFYNKMPYCSDREINQKNKLNPTTFSIVSQGQENLLHYILQCRRILTIHEGLRWFDIKRYGIEVRRLQTQSSGVITVADRLQSEDPRKAIQLPAEVITAGLEKNPR